MELTFKEACFDLTEGETKWRVWFYYDESGRVLKDGNVVYEFNNITIASLNNALHFIKKSKLNEKTT